MVGNNVYLNLISLNKYTSKLTILEYEEGTFTLWRSWNIKNGFVESRLGTFICVYFFLIMIT